MTMDIVGNPQIADIVDAAAGHKLPDDAHEAINSYAAEVGLDPALLGNQVRRRLGDSWRSERGIDFEKLLSLTADEAAALMPQASRPAKIKPGWLGFSTAEVDPACTGAPALLGSQARAALGVDDEERLKAHCTACAACQGISVRFEAAAAAFRSAVRSSDGPRDAVDLTAASEIQRTGWVPKRANERDHRPDTEAHARPSPKHARPRPGSGSSSREKRSTWLPPELKPSRVSPTLLDTEGQSESSEPSAWIPRAVRGPGSAAAPADKGGSRGDRGLLPGALLTAPGAYGDAAPEQAETLAAVTPPSRHQRLADLVKLRQWAAQPFVSRYHRAERPDARPDKRGAPIGKLRAASLPSRKRLNRFIAARRRPGRPKTAVTALIVSGGALVALAAIMAIVALVTSGGKRRSAFAPPAAPATGPVTFTLPPAVQPPSNRHPRRRAKPSGTLGIGRNSTTTAGNRQSATRSASGITRSPSTSKTSSTSTSTPRRSSSAGTGGGPSSGTGGRQGP